MTAYAFIDTNILVWDGLILAAARFAGVNMLLSAGAAPIHLFESSG
ncbi:MAG TPA: hypothetical protein PLT74_09965 [Kiritimatiellia bacterium]|nr:hypothetical protein [Kiritimatiellia bacterium]